MGKELENIFHTNGQEVYEKVLNISSRQIYYHYHCTPNEQS